MVDQDYNIYTSAKLSFRRVVGQAEQLRLRVAVGVGRGQPRVGPARAERTEAPVLRRV